MMQTEQISFDDPVACTKWLPINDAVMGGMSTSQLRYDPSGHAVFEGVVSWSAMGGVRVGSRRTGGSWLAWHPRAVGLNHIHYDQLMAGFASAGGAPILGAHKKSPEPWAFMNLLLSSDSNVFFFEIHF